MNTHAETKHKEEPWWITGKPNTLGTYTVFHGHHRTQMASNQICQASTLFHARLIAAAPDLLDSLDPDALEAIADELFGTFQNSARAESLRVIAKKQRAAIAKATEGAQ